MYAGCVLRKILEYISAIAWLFEKEKQYSLSY